MASIVKWVCTREPKEILSYPWDCCCVVDEYFANPDLLCRVPGPVLEYLCMQIVIEVGQNDRGRIYGCP